MRNFDREKPVPDSLFRVYKGLYSYDKTPLHAGVRVNGRDRGLETREDHVSCGIR